MYFRYETERLLLRVLDEFHSREVLEFYRKNQELFGKYDGIKPGNYYTRRYQEEVLRLEKRSAIQGQGVRFYVFLKGRPERIIGTISLQNILRIPYESGILGYRFDGDYHHQGYALEAVEKLIGIGFKELGLHRIAAYVQKNNRASIRLLVRLGFQWEGTIRQFAKIGDSWRDHEMYGLLREERI